jgi:alpha-tubulin suppressor-like RCC1 family protein
LFLNFFKFSFNFFYLECGKLFSVGSNFFGCIGERLPNKNCPVIKQIEFFKNIFIDDIVCGLNHCLSISKGGEIYSWGDNKYGKIGNGKIEKKQKTPIKIFKIDIKKQ